MYKVISMMDDIVLLESELNQLCENIVNDFRCPISLEVMTEPVIASDGHTYERYAIETYFIATLKNKFQEIEALISEDDYEGVEPLLSDFISNSNKHDLLDLYERVVNQFNLEVEGVPGVDDVIKSPKTGAPMTDVYIISNTRFREILLFYQRNTLFTPLPSDLRDPVSVVQVAGAPAVPPLGQYDFPGNILDNLKSLQSFSFREIAPTISDYGEFEFSYSQNGICVSLGNGSYRMLDLARLSEWGITRHSWCLIRTDVQMILDKLDSIPNRFRFLSMPDMQLDTLLQSSSSPSLKLGFLTYNKQPMGTVCTLEVPAGELYLDRRLVDSLVRGAICRLDERGVSKMQEFEGFLKAYSSNASMLCPVSIRGLWKDFKRVHPEVFVADYFYMESERESKCNDLIDCFFSRPYFDWILNEDDYFKPKLDDSHLLKEWLDSNVSFDYGYCESVLLEFVSSLSAHVDISILPLDSDVRHPGYSTEFVQEWIILTSHEVANWNSHIINWLTSHHPGIYEWGDSINYKYLSKGVRALAMHCESEQTRFRDTFPDHVDVIKVTNTSGVTRAHASKLNEGEMLFLHKGESSVLRVVYKYNGRIFMNDVNYSDDIPEFLGSDDIKRVLSELSIKRPNDITDYC